MKKVLLFALLALSASISHAFSGKVYYVRPGGNNSNTGLDSISAFATIQHGVDQLYAGDSLVVFAGTYNEKVSITARSGTASNRIVVNGVGKVVVTKNLEQWKAIFNIAKQSYITVRNIHVENSTWYGFLVAPSDGPRPRNIKIINCTTRNTGTSGIYAIDADSLYIVGNTVINACSEKIEPVGGKGSQECITLSGVKNFSVTDNVVRNSGGSNTGGEGINAKYGSSDGEIARNKLYEIDRLGIYVDGFSRPVTNVRIYGNTVHHCRHGIVIASEQGGKVSNIYVYNNLTYRNRYDGIVIGDYKNNGPRRNIWIVNNTSVLNGTDNKGNGIRVDKLANVDSVYVYNNICSFNRESNLTYKTTNPSDTVKASNNLMFEFGSSEAGKFALKTDPLFVDTLHNNFRLREGSPALHYGLYTGDTLQLRDITRILRNPASIDLGAYEFLTGQNPPAVSLVLPTNGESVLQGSVISLKATATDANSIAYVDFYADTTHLGKVYTPNASGQYEYVWNGAAPGTYNWKAIATDKLGKSTATATRSITVLAPQARSESQETTENAGPYTIHPNPATGKVNITNWKEGEPVQLLDSEGAVIKQSKAGEVNLEGLPSGVYILIHSGNTYRIVKE